MMTYPDDDILVENVWFILIVYTPPPFLSFLALYIYQLIISYTHLITLEPFFINFK